MSEPYGLPPDASINYGALGFPAWVDQLCRQWGLDSSTYPGHQTADRPDIGSAPNPQGLNRGIDWAGPPDKMMAFAKWLIAVAPPRSSGYGPPGIEMVIHQSPITGERVWYPPWVNFDDDLPNHTDHVHTRHSAAIDVGPLPPPSLTRTERYALTIIQEGQKRGISRKGICIALTVPPVETGWRVLSNIDVPESGRSPHDGEGGDHDSCGLFQQRLAWGPVSCLMDVACSAGLFYDGGASGQPGLTDFDYNADYQSPGQFAADVQQPAAQYRDRYDQHWDEANQLYDQLSGIEDEMAGVNVDGLNTLIDKFLTTWPSRSMFADSNNKVDDAVGLGLNTDGNAWNVPMILGALLGVPYAVTQVQRMAQGQFPPGSHVATDPWLRQVAQDFAVRLAPLCGIAGGLSGTPIPIPTPTPAPTPDPKAGAVGPSALVGLAGMAATGVVWVLQALIPHLPPLAAGVATGIIWLLTAIGVVKAPNQPKTKTAPKHELPTATPDTPATPVAPPAEPEPPAPSLPYAPPQPPAPAVSSDVAHAAATAAAAEITALADLEVHEVEALRDKLKTTLTQGG